MLITSSRSYSQTEIDAAKLMPNIPPSPTVAALGDYANINYGVKNFLGASDVRIPLDTLKSDGFNLPISLSYNTRGIKVAETASWVGLGWSLNAGGVITRVTRGKNDDQKVLGRMITTVYDSIRNITNENTSENSRRIYNIFDSGRAIGENIYGEFAGGDTEPDIFYFNFCGYTGKFLMGEDHQIKLIPSTDLSFTYQIDNNNSIIQFTVIDPKGIKYIFNDCEYTEAVHYGPAAFLSISPTVGSTLATSDIGNSAWYLSKIIMLNNQEINFSYEEEDIEVPSSPVTAVRNCRDGDCEGSSNVGYGSPQVMGSPTISTIKAKRLTSIESDVYKVLFEGGSNRLDLNGSKFLSRILIYDKQNNKTVKGFEFTYDYNQGLIEENWAKNFELEDKNDYSKRLMLRQVCQLDHNLSPLQPYLFYYNEQGTIGSRLTKQQDLWGFYNHNNAKTTAPEVYIYPNDPNPDRTHPTAFRRMGYGGLELHLAGANRMVNPDYVSLCALTKIMYPSRGSTQFDYEPNDFFFEGRNIQGGGIRIRKLTTSDGIGYSKDVIKLYSYKDANDTTRSSGALINLPIVGYIENTHAYIDESATPNATWAGYPIADCRLYDLTDVNFYNKFLTRLSAPAYCLGGFDGIDVAYTQVTEKQLNNGETRYHFSCPGIHGQITDQAGDYCDSGIEGYCDGLFQNFENHYCHSYYAHFVPRNGPIPLPDLKGMEMNAYYTAPYPPSTNYDWNRGLLISKMQYDNSGHLVYSEENKYELYYPHGKIAPTYVTGFKVIRSDNWNLDARNNLSTGELGDSSIPSSSIYIFSKYKLITEVAKVLKQRDVTQYDLAGNPLKTSYVYSYGAVYHQNPRLMQWTDSKGSTWATNYIYAYDLKDKITFNTTQPAKGYQSLIEKNMNPLVWENTYLLKGSEKYFSDGAITYYDIFNNQVLPSAFKKLETASPIPVEAFGDEIDGGNISVDEQYKPSHEFIKYDTKGNLQEYKVSSNLSNSVIWDYLKERPVAIAKGAQLSDIAYTSFETRDETASGWIFDNPFFEDNSDNPNAPSVYSATGNRLYNLGNSVGISKAGLDSSKKYTVSFYYKYGLPIVTASNVQLISNTINDTSNPLKMNLAVYEISNSTSVNVHIGGDILIDELRLFPKDTEMTTYAYDPLVGVISSADAKGQITHYEYDEFQRLKTIKDSKGNIIKAYDYHYKP